MIDEWVTKVLEQGYGQETPLEERNLNHCINDYNNPIFAAKLSDIQKYDELTYVKTFSGESCHLKFSICV